MADVDRIAPPVPPLPAPVGRRVDTPRRQRQSERRRPERPDSEPRPPEEPHGSPDHIDEYV